MLPEQFEYWPPVIIKHIDCSSKKEVTIGMAMISKSRKLYIEATIPYRAKEVTIQTADIGGFSLLFLIEGQSSIHKSFHRYKPIFW